MRWVLLAGFGWLAMGLAVAVAFGRSIALGERQPAHRRDAGPAPAPSAQDAASSTSAGAIPAIRDEREAAASASLPIDALVLIYSARNSAAVVSNALVDLRENAPSSSQATLLWTLQRQASLAERLLDSLLSSSPSDLLEQLDNLGLDQIDVDRILRPVSTEGEPPSRRG